jgi:hypothetical protein
LNKNNKKSKVAKMNELLSAVFESWTNKEVAPKPDEPPTKDPLMGFEHRVERVAPLTDEQMANARIPAQARDYCADKYIQLRKCIRQEFPLNVKCKHERHNYDICLIEEYVA